MKEIVLGLLGLGNIGGGVWDLIRAVCQQFWKTQQWPQDWKRSIFILIPKKGNAKEMANQTNWISSLRMLSSEGGRE